MTESSSSLDISTKLERIAKLARKIRGTNLTTLAHHIDVDWLREAYRRTRKDGARGVDGQSAEQYAETLEGNLQDLLDRAKSGRYRAPPVRRVHIPKGDGTETRPIGIPTFEDKVLLRAVVMVIGEVYEQEFHDFSYGFRPGRSAHQALQAIRNAAWRMGGGWIVEVDIRKFFDRDVQPVLHGQAEAVRYADDLAVLFERREDAERFLAVLPKRFGRFGLTLHPDKTRLIPFRRPDRVAPDDDQPGTFDLLGFTHHWGLSLNGRWIVKQRTAKDRFSRALRRIDEWCRWHRHDSLKTQHLTLVKKMKGHYAYFGITGNNVAIGRFFYEVRRLWRRALARRSQQSLPWSTMQRILKRYALPTPRIVHRYGT